MDTKDFRRKMHKYPERAGMEQTTSELIVQELESAGIAFKKLGGNTILASIEGRRGNLERCVVLRANMYALAVEEMTGVEYSSQNEGVMHACGNDLNMAVVMGVLKRLQQSRDFEGTLLALFQSGCDCRCSGAREVVAGNPFEGYKVAAVLGESLNPDLQVGEIGFCPGKFMASVDGLRFVVRGMGGCSALRQRVNDPVVALADLVMRLNAFNSDVCVVSVGKVVADGSMDRIPDTASCEGVMRTFDEKLRQRVKDMMLGAVQEIEYKYDVEIESQFDDESPCVENDKHLSYEAMLQADSHGFKVVDLERSFMKDDFGCYAQLYPSLLYHLGVGRESGSINSSTFLPDEKALEVGEEFMSQLALNILNR